MRKGKGMLPEKKTVSAKAVLADLRSGMTDEELTDKYQISAKGLQSLLDKMLKAGLLQPGELEKRRPPESPEVVFDLDETRSPSTAPTVITGKKEPAQSAERNGKLAKLQEALNAGILNREEYERKKAELNGQQGTSDALTKLKDLRDAGVLSQAEFEKKAAQLSGNPSPSFSGIPRNETDLQIDPYYRGVFKEIENGKLRRINGYALLGGAFWYFYKGMWLKGLVYFVCAVVLAVIFPGVGALPVWVTASFYANWDYYLYKVHGEQFFTSHWVSNSFPVDLQKRFLVNE